jgi:hypothetical protein
MTQGKDELELALKRAIELSRWEEVDQLMIALDNIGTVGLTVLPKKEVEE